MTRTKMTFFLAALLILTSLVVSCSAAPTSLPSPSPIPPTESHALPSPTDTLLPPTATSTSTATILPTETSTSEPSPTLTETLVPTETATPSPQLTTKAILPENAILVYFIIPDTGGPVACGDSLVPVYSGLVRQGDLKEDIATAFKRLFSYGVKYVDNLYNPLYQSHLNIEQIDIFNQGKKVNIHTKGGFVKPKEDCDQLRYRAQVWATIRQFPGVKEVNIWVGSALLGDLLAALDK